MAEPFRLLLQNKNGNPAPRKKLQYFRAYGLANSPLEFMMRSPSQGTRMSRAFDFTVAEYIAWLNRNLEPAAIKNTRPLVPPISQSTDDGRTLHMGLLNQHLGWAIYENAHGRVSLIYFTGQGDGSAESGVDLILATMATVRAANQTSAREKRTSRLTLDLIRVEGKVIVQDGIEYQPGLIEEAGFTLTIRRASVRDSE